MGYSTSVKTVRDGKITLQSGGGSPVTLEVAYEGEGNFSYDGNGETAARLPIYDRGVVVGVRKQADEAFRSVTFQVDLRTLTDDTAGSVIDFINKTNAYSANESTSTNSDFYTINVIYEISAVTSLGDDHDYKITMTDCCGLYSITEGYPTTISLTFESYGTTTRATV